MPSGSCQLSRRHILTVLLLGVAAAQPAPAISEDGSDKREPDGDELAIAGFIELNLFCDRGIAQFTMYDDEHFETKDLKEHQEFTRLMTAVEDAAAYLESLPIWTQSDTLRREAPTLPLRSKNLAGVRDDAD